MNKYCKFTLAFLYLEIFSRQTTGLDFIQYQCEYSNSSCLNISDAKVNWETANSTCTMQGGRSFNPILDVIGRNGIPGDTGGKYYWTEFHRVPNTEYFQTTDGLNLSNSSYFDDYSWKLNHPIDNIDCVGFDGESYEFLSLACNTSHLGVCRIDEATCDALVEEYRDICPSLALRPEKLTENTLRDLSSNFNVTTGDYILLYNSSIELVVTQVSANTTTEITQNGDSIQISEDPYGARKTFVWTEYAYYYTSTFRVSSDVITVYTSSISSVANLTIVFSGYYIAEEHECVHLTPEGHWSAEGVETEIISERTVQCTTKIKNISIIALGRFIIPRVIRNSLIGLSGIIAFISLLLLLSSLVIFIASGKKFFSHDINILHFNNTLSLLLALLSIPFLPLPIYYPASCIPISFFILFLWTNVFLSSLSIAIVVFYTIWIVSINHTARKLSIFLIPIGWGVSLLWALIWTTIRHFVLVRSSGYRCFYTSDLKFEIDLSFLVPMIAILLINTALLIASLFKVWLVLRKQSSQQGELKRLRKVVISGILLVPALGLAFLPLSLFANQLYKTPEGINRFERNILASLIILFINSPIGIIHFILITCQIRESIIRKCCCCRRITPAQIAHSLHLNIVRPRPKQNNHQTVIEDSTIQQTPEDTIPDSVPSNDSAVFSNDSTQAVI